MCFHRKFVYFFVIIHFVQSGVKNDNKAVPAIYLFFLKTVSEHLKNTFLFNVGNTSSYLNFIVPPSKPDSISVVYKPADPLISSFKHMEYSTSTAILTLTPKENETISAFQSVKQNDKTEYSRIQTDDYETTTSMSSEVDFSKTSIVEGDSITVICTGEVGKPPAKHIFQKLLFGQIVPMKSTFTAASISEMSDNCSYYRTSNLTFQVTSEDNNAVIRCVVNSSMADPDMYVETEPIEVHCKYIICNLISGIMFPL